MTADKPDSKEICFIPNNNYRTFLEKLSPDMMRPGVMVDTAGNAVGIIRECQATRLDSARAWGRLALSRAL